MIDVAPLFLGSQQRYFERQFIAVQPAVANSGADVVRAVLDGTTDLGFSNIVSLLLAREKGAPVVAMAAGASSTGVPGADVHAVLVAGDSDIKRARDLAGRRVAVNSVGNIGDATVMVGVEKDGADPSQVIFTEMPFPEMPAALADGKVDAAWTSEPFVTAMRADGGRILFNNLTQTYRKVQIAAYFTTERRLSSDRALIDDFVDGMNDSLAYTRDHQLRARLTLPAYTKISIEMARTANLPDWPVGLDPVSARILGSAARRFGVLANPPDVKGLLRLA